MLFNINNKLAQLLGFETQSAEDIKMEKELRELSREDIIHSVTIHEPRAEKKEDDVVGKEEITQDVVETTTEETVTVSVETNEIEQTKTKVETQEENQVTTTENEEQTGSEDVSEDTVVDTTQSATEPMAESEEQPSNDVSDIEPSDLTHSAETEQSVQSEQVEVTQVTTEENLTEGIELSSQSEEVVTDIVESVTEVADVDNAKIDVPAPSNETIEELERVKQELAQMKAKEAEQALKLEKAEIEREVNQDYAGIPLSTNETVDILYEIKNSVLNEGTKEFIFNSLKQLSSSNLKDCQEVGHQLNVEPKSEKELLNEKVKQAQKEFDLTEGQALLYVTGARNLKQAKDATSKARRRK